MCYQIVDELMEREHQYCFHKCNTAFHRNCQETGKHVVSFAAVITVIMQCTAHGEKRCMMTLITTAKETMGMRY